jgi:hypothetical protein
MIRQYKALVRSCTEQGIIVLAVRQLIYKQFDLRQIALDPNKLCGNQMTV